MTGLTPTSDESDQRLAPQFGAIFAAIGFLLAIASLAARGPQPTITIDPSRIPAGAELTVGDFQLPSGEQQALSLMNSSSYTCTSTPPDMTSPIRAKRISPCSMAAPAPASDDRHEHVGRRTCAPGPVERVSPGGPRMRGPGQIFPNRPPQRAGS
jgi:hypothetical protein